VGKTHVTNITIRESSIHAVLQFSNSYQRDNSPNKLLYLSRRPCVCGIFVFTGRVHFRCEVLRTVENLMKMQLLENFEQLPPMERIKIKSKA
jgi:hypothetical protein